MSQRLKDDGKRDGTPGAIVKPKGGSANPLTDDRSKPLKGAETAAEKLLERLRKGIGSAAFGGVFVYNAYFGRITPELSDSGQAMVMRKGRKEGESERGDEEQGEQVSNDLVPLVTIFSDTTDHLQAEEPAAENYHDGPAPADYVIEMPGRLAAEERPFDIFGAQMEPLGILHSESFVLLNIAPPRVPFEFEGGMHEVEIGGVMTDLHVGFPECSSLGYREGMDRRMGRVPPFIESMPREEPAEVRPLDTSSEPLSVRLRMDRIEDMGQEITFSHLVEETVAQLPEKKGVLQRLGEVVDKCKRKLGIGDKEE